MGNKISSNSSEFNISASNHKQTGGNTHMQQLQHSDSDSEMSLSFLDSDGDYNQVKYGGSSIATEDTVKTEDFINLLKSKIDNLPNQTLQLNHQQLLSDTSDMSETSVFLNNNQTAQVGGHLSDTDYQTIARAAREYLRNEALYQHGGGSDDDSDADSDDELDDDDEEESSEEKKKPAKRLTKNDKSNAANAVQRGMKKQTKHSTKNRMSDSINFNSDSSNISNESVQSDEYQTGSSESFGTSASSEVTTKLATPYLESDSINTSSINLVSFDHPVFDLKKNNKARKAAKHSKKASRY
jgi:hypothetical protein